MGIKPSLKSLSESYCGLVLNKSGTNYEWDSKRSEFQPRSAEYAAKDALASLLVFRKMIQKPKMMIQEESEFLFETEQDLFSFGIRPDYSNAKRQIQVVQDCVPIETFLVCIDHLQKVFQKKEKRICRRALRAILMYNFELFYGLDKKSLHEKADQLLRLLEKESVIVKQE